MDSLTAWALISGATITGIGFGIVLSTAVTPATTPAAQEVSWGISCVQKQGKPIVVHQDLGNDQVETRLCIKRSALL